MSNFATIVVVLCLTGAMLYLMWSQRTQAIRLQNVYERVERLETETLDSEDVCKLVRSTIDDAGTPSSPVAHEENGGEEKKKTGD